MHAFLRAILFTLVFVPAILLAAPIDLPVNSYAGTQHKVVVDSERVGEYRKLAASIGLDYDKEYGYLEFADAKRANKIGVAGQYKSLLHSTGGNSDDMEADMRAMKAPIHWEMWYYDNHNMTVIYQIRNEGERSYVKLLKLAKGRVPALHQR